MVIVLLVILFLLMGRFVAEANKSTQIPTVINVPACPPHKWRHVEIKDQDGNTVRWSMTCDVCGPLRPLDAPKKMDY